MYVQNVLYTHGFHCVTTIQNCTFSINYNIRENACVYLYMYIHLYSCMIERDCVWECIMYTYDINQPPINMSICVHCTCKFSYEDNGGWSPGQLSSGGSTTNSTAGLCVCVKKQRVNYKAVHIQVIARVHKKEREYLTLQTMFTKC